MRFLQIRRLPLACLLVLASLNLSACGDGKEDSNESTTPGTSSSPPDKETSTDAGAPEAKPEGLIRVQHVLISFDGANDNPGTGRVAGRTKEVAEALHREILDRAKNGEDFATLMKQYSDDPGPGTYGMADDGANPPSDDYLTRAGSAKSFGDVAFSLEVGQIKVASYHKKDSPYGWHIIKRIE
jgi:hypothetical protein